MVVRIVITYSPKMYMVEMVQTMRSLKITHIEYFISEFFSFFDKSLK